MSNTLDKYDEIFIVTFLKGMVELTEEQIEDANLDFGYRALFESTRLELEKKTMENIINNIKLEE